LCLLPRQGGYVFGFVALSVSGITGKVFNDFFDEIFRRVGCVTGKKRLDFGDDPDSDGDSGIV